VRGRHEHRDLHGDCDLSLRAWPADLAATGVKPVSP
jgi:hypothetical protein